MELIPYVAAFGVIGFLIIMGFGVVIAKFYRRVDQGQALIVNKMKAGSMVTFTGGVVYPIIHRAEVMDISVKTIHIDRRGKEGLICRDNIRADIRVTFFVRVNKTQDDVLKVAQAIGCLRASDHNTLDELFSAKFSEALKTVGKRLDFVDLYTKREEFKNEIIDVIGRDLNGYALEDAAIDFLEQTPLVALDPSNILDAQGISKITELTAVEHIRTNEYQNREKKLVKKQDVEAIEAILELDRQRADAENRQQREIMTVKAREQAETQKVQAEETLKADTARIKTEELLAVAEENKAREVEFAHKNRERVILVETERVEKERALEAILRERDVELNRIAKEKALEGERKAIADIVRTRIAVDRTVAEEEERIKHVRVVQEADRLRQAVVIAAEGQAQEQLVKDIKAAEAAEASAKFRARERLVLAEAELEVADKAAKGMVRWAEGEQAKAAAEGLAHVRVKEMDAAATEKLGRAEAVVVREKGLAEASAVQEKMTAEANGLAHKAESMKALDERTRQHEEYRMRIDRDRAVALEALHVEKEIAATRAEVLGKALEHAKIDIVGGDGQFFDRIVGSAAAGRSIDRFIDSSDAVKGVLGEYLSGQKSLPDDIKEILAKSGTGGHALEGLTIAAVLTHFVSRSNGEDRAKVTKLLETAQSLGIHDRTIS